MYAFTFDNYTTASNINTAASNINTASTSTGYIGAWTRNTLFEPEFSASYYTDYYPDPTHRLWHEFTMKIPDWNIGYTVTDPAKNEIQEDDLLELIGV